jgi:cobalt-zinc-cadmium efflux system outer membrane protein
VLQSFFAGTARDVARIEAMRAPATAAALPGVNELLARALGVRGEWMAFQHDAEAAGLAEQAARRRVVPEPEVVAGTKSSNAGTGDVGSIFSVHVAIPLFDRGGAERATAQARARQASAEAEAFRAALQAGIAAWRTAVIERRTIADRYRTLAAATADRIEHIAQVSYDAGERGILELLDAYRTAAAARVRQVELDAAVREAEIELEFVSGWELP